MAWSYSRLKNFETCAKKYYEVDVTKHYNDSNEQLLWGNEVHAAIANALTGKAPLPGTMSEYQQWVDHVRGFNGSLRVEQKYALTRDLQPCEYFAPKVWYRGVGDAVLIAPDETFALVWDWKTGKLLHDHVQLFLMAACVFAYHPKVRTVRAHFVWLKDGAKTHDDYRRKEMGNEWIPVLDRVGAFEAAAKNFEYPPKPSGLCMRNCPVISCAFHGKGNR